MHRNVAIDGVVQRRRLGTIHVFREQNNGRIAMAHGQDFLTVFRCLVRVGNPEDQPRILREGRFGSEERLDKAGRVLLLQDTEGVYC